MLSSTALVTLPQALNWLGIATEANVEILEILIDGITGEFERVARRPLKLQTISRRLDGSGEGWIRLPYWPIHIVRSIVRLNSDGTTDSEILNTTSPEELSGPEFTVNPLDGTLRLYSGSFPAGDSNVIVSWDVGFSSDSSEMKLLRRLCLIQLQSEYRQWKDNDFGIASRQFQDGGITFERSTDGLMPRIAKALQDFQIKRAG